MKTYYTLFLLLVSGICFGQLEPISEINAEKLSKSGLEIFSLFGDDEQGNSVVVHSKRSMYVSVLDNRFREIQGKKIKIPNYSHSYSSYFQDRKNIYKIFGESQPNNFSNRPPEGLIINKKTFEYKFETLIDLVRGEKFLFHKIDENKVYLFTYFKQSSILKIYKLEEFKVVKVVEIGFEEFKNINRFFLKEITSKDIHFADGNFFIMKKNSDFKIQLYSVNFENSELSINEFDLNLNRESIEFRGFSNPVKLFASDIIEDKMLVLFRLKKGFYLKIFDLNSAELLETINLVENNSTSNVSCFYSSGTFDFTQMILKGTVSTIEDFNKKNMKFGLRGGSTTFLDIFNLGSKYLLVFGKKRMVTHQTPVAGGAVSMGWNSKNLGYVSNFSFIEFERENQTNKKTDETFEGIQEFRAHYKSGLSKYVGIRKNEVSKISFTNSGIRMVAYNREHRNIIIY